jgi:hypothetical protein
MRYISIKGKELVNGIRTRNERAATRSVVLFILYWDPRVSYVVSDLGKWRKKMYNPLWRRLLAIISLFCRTVRVTFTPSQIRIRIIIQ